MRTIFIDDALISRFWSKVERKGPEDCWLYTAKSGSFSGYGHVMCKTNVGFRPIRAHRLAWEIVHGPVDDGLGVLHRCDVRRCVNPAHLFLGTPRDNYQDSHHKNRHSAFERHGMHKLTWKEVNALRAAEASGLSRRQLSAMFGISATQVARIVRMQSWR